MPVSKQPHLIANRFNVVHDILDEERLSMSSVNTEIGRNQIFISYSHDDKVWLERFQTILKPLSKRYTLEVWDDTKIKPGENWRERIDQALNSVRAALLLVTPNFLASDFIAEDELPFLLEATRAGRIKLFWVAVSASMYQVTELKNFRAANNPDTPLDGLKSSKVNKEITQICTEIYKFMTEPDTWQTPTREAGPRSVEATGSVVSNGLLTLTELLLRPQIQTDLLLYREQFKRVQERIERITDYLLLHDRLFEIEAIYKNLALEAEHSTDDVNALMNLRMLSRNLHRLLDEVRNVASHLSTKFDGLISEISGIDKQLRHFIESSNREERMELLQRLSNLVEIYPMQIDHGMFRELQSIPLPDLVEVLEAVHQELLKVDVIPTGAQQLVNGINALKNLGRQLETLRDENEQWGAIDNELRFGENLDELTMRWSGLKAKWWPRLKAKTARLYTGHEREEWAASMIETEARLDEALASHESINAENLFTNYRNQVTWRAFDVRKNILQTLNGLREIGETLSFMTNAFDLSAQ